MSEASDSAGPAVAGRPLIRWVTNIPAPYRVALWRTLLADCQLDVLCMARNEPGRDWDLPGEVPWITYADAPAAHGISDSTIYLPNSRLFAWLHRTRNAACTVIDGWDSPAYAAALAWSRARTPRTLIWYRTTAGSQRFGRGPVAAVRRRLLLSADGVLTTPGQSASVLARIGVPAERIIVAPNPVDTERFERAVQRRKELGTDTRRAGHTFLYVGQLIPRKNVRSLIDAFVAIQAPQDRLLIVGAGPDAAALQGQVLERGVGGSVQFLGALKGTELIDAYAMSDTLVLPSLSEVWGLVVNEALSAGLDVVASEQTGVAASLVGTEGAFVTRTDASSIARALDQSRGAWTGPRASDRRSPPTDETARIILDFASPVGRRL